MATYKQKLPRVHHVEYDSEESEQEWVMFNASNQPIERRLVNNVSDDEEWHVLSDTPVEDIIPAFGSNSEFASGGSDCDSEHFCETARSIELLPEGQDSSQFTRKMPYHDGMGNFFDGTLSDGSSNDSLTSPTINSDFARHAVSSSYRDNELPSHDLKGSAISNDTRRTDTPIPIGRNSRESWITKVRNVFRTVDDVSAINSQEQTQQIYHKFAKSASSVANFELGDLENNPIKVLSNIGNENADSTTYTTITTQYVDTLPSQSSQTNNLEKLPISMAHPFDSPSSTNVVDSPRTEKHVSTKTRFNNRLFVPKNPMTVNFAPTISKDMLNEMKSTENVNSADHQKQQSSTSQISSQSDKNSLLSAVWTTFRRITNNIIVSDDTDPIPNDYSHHTNLFTSSNHNTHNTGLASIITGENHYDTSYLPFGNILTLSELCPSLHSYKSHYSSSSTPSTSHNKRRNSITSSPNTTRILLTPVSSSTSLKSFTSRAGSDCGLESGRGIGRGTTLEAPLVV